MPQSFERQRLGVDGLPGQHAAQGDLGRGHQAQVAVFDAVDLRFRPAGNVADAGQDVVAGQVGRGHRRKALAHQHVDRVALQGQLQQHGLVLEEVEAVPGHAGPGLEIHQIEFLGQLHVVQRLEIELRQRRLAAKQLQVRLVVHADRRVGVRHVGNLPVDRVQLGGHLRRVPLCSGLGLLAKLPALFLAGLAFGRVLGLADRLGDLVRLAIELLDLDLAGALRSRFELDKAVHVNLDAAVDAVLFHQFGVFDDESAVEHGWWRGDRGQGTVKDKRSPSARGSTEMRRRG